jgi:hypothetical protein
LEVLRRKLSKSGSWSLGAWASKKGTLLAGLAGIEGKVGMEILWEVSQTPEDISGKISQGQDSILFPV